MSARKHFFVFGTHRKLVTFSYNLKYERAIMRINQVVFQKIMAKNNLLKKKPTFSLEFSNGQALVFS